MISVGWSASMSRLPSEDEPQRLSLATKVLRSTAAVCSSQSPRSSFSRQDAAGSDSQFSGGMTTHAKSDDHTTQSAHHARASKTSSACRGSDQGDGILKTLRFASCQLKHMHWWGSLANHWRPALQRCDFNPKQLSTRAWDGSRIQETS